MLGVLLQAEIELAGVGLLWEDDGAEALEDEDGGHVVVRGVALHRVHANLDERPGLLLEQKYLLILHTTCYFTPCLHSLLKYILNLY